MKVKRNSNKFYCPSDDADDDAMVELGIGGEHSIISAGTLEGRLVATVDSCSEAGEDRFLN